METKEYQEVTAQSKKESKKLSRASLEVRKPTTSTGLTEPYCIALFMKNFKFPATIAAISSLHGKKVSTGASTMKYDVFTDVHDVPKKVYIHCSAIFDGSLRKTIPKEDFKIIKRAETEMRQYLSDDIYSRIYFLEIHFDKNIAKLASKPLSK